MSEVLEYWRGRALTSDAPGSDDRIAKELEMRAIGEFVLTAQMMSRADLAVLDMGCGDGETAVRVAELCGVSVVGVDAVDAMVERAKLRPPPTRGSVQFAGGDVRDWIKGSFDLVYTQRLIVNLEDWPMQLKAIHDLWGAVAPGGWLVLCECSFEGLARVNELRKCVGLDAIEPPWHNRYLRDEEMGALGAELVLLGAVQGSVYDFSSTYYFLSRVVNAKLAADAGVAPSYDSPINRMALQLPEIADRGQGRIWAWRKRA